MLSIFATTDHIEEVQNCIAQEARLNELVNVLDFLSHKPSPSGFNLIIRRKHIVFPIDWYNVMPPYILPEEVHFTPENLLGLVFARLGNYEKTHHYLAKSNPTLYTELDFINRLQNGIPVNPEELISEYSEFEEYRLMHNQALVRHYAASESNFDIEKTRYFYREAMLSAPNDEYKAFTVKQYATLLTDLGQLDFAENELLAAIQYALSDEAKIELKNVLATVWMQKLSVPYDATLLAQLKEILWEILQNHEQQERLPEVGLLLIDAAHIANISESFAEALGYINRAIGIFRDEEMPELLANAQLRKGTLLYTWAQNGQPQFYRGAMESYQEALKIFTREDAPAVFGDIHHHLGVIYSEIPDEVQKKSIWAAVSSASFNEAMQFYNKDNFPYEYAMICNSFGNAMTKYPAALHSDNYEKALFYYQEALNIRTAAAYPVERAITLLNYVEACWYVNNSEDEWNESLYYDMMSKAEEVKKLTTDTQMRTDADRHLAKLAELRKIFS